MDSDAFGHDLSCVCVECAKFREYAKYLDDQITGYPNHYVINGDPSHCGCSEHGGWWNLNKRPEATDAP